MDDDDIVVASSSSLAKNKKYVYIRMKDEDFLKLKQLIARREKKERKKQTREKYLAFEDVTQEIKRILIEIDQLKDLFMDIITKKLP
jgi:hypothetical protein